MHLDHPWSLALDFWPLRPLCSSEYKEHSEKKHKDRDKLKHSNSSSDKHREKHKEKRKEEKVCSLLGKAFSVVDITFWYRGKIIFFMEINMKVLKFCFAQDFKENNPYFVFLID